MTRNLPPLILTAACAPMAARPTACAVPAQAPSPPVIEEEAIRLLTRTVSAEAAVPLDRFAPWFIAAPLESLLPGGGGLPAVVGTRPLSALTFGEVGSGRVVCLADGATALEQVIAHEPGARFRYVVWGYTSPQAAPVAYGVGEFRFDARGTATAIEWTYAFRLKEDRLPGSLGALGRGLFRLAFLDTRYAAFMREGMAAILREAEAAQAP